MFASPLRSTALALVAGSLAVSLTLAASSAMAATHSSKLCSTSTVVTSVPLPSLPTTDSLRAITKAVDALPKDVRLLEKEHVALLEESSSARAPIAKTALHDAATSVALERAALESVIAQELTVALHPHRSTAVMNLAGKLIDATSAAAAANAYLRIELGTLPKGCQ